MTRLEFYAKYGSVKVKFNNYYKYTFTYKTILPDGKVLSCDYGGNSYDIYSHGVSSDSEETVAGLYPHGGSVYDNGVLVESFYDY